MFGCYPGILVKFPHWPPNHPHTLIASSLCLLSTNKMVHSGATWLPSHHPGGHCTLVDPLDPPPPHVKLFECQEKRCINVTKQYYKGGSHSIFILQKSTTTNFLVTNNLQNIFICVKKSYRFGTNWGWVKDDRILIFGWTISLSPVWTEVFVISVHAAVFVAVGYSRSSWLPSSNCFERIRTPLERWLRETWRNSSNFTRFSLTTHSFIKDWTWAG